MLNRYSVTTEKLDASKLDYIANRSERGKQAVEDLRQSRIASLKRQAGIKE
jgi:COX assembly protein 1